jgi:hypothetical protein
METEGSLPCSQEPASCLYPELDECIAHPKILFKLILELINLAPCREVVWRNGGIDRSILNLGIRLGWLVSFTGRSHYPRYPMDRRLGAPQIRPGHCQEIPLPCRESNTGSSTIQPVSHRYTERSIPAPSRFILILSSHLLVRLFQLVSTIHVFLDQIFVCVSTVPDAYYMSCPYHPL